MSKRKNYQKTRRKLRRQYNKSDVAFDSMAAPKRGWGAGKAKGFDRRKDLNDSQD